MSIIDGLNRGSYKPKHFSDCSESETIRSTIIKEVFSLLWRDFGARPYGRTSVYAASGCDEIRSLHPDYVSGNYWIVGSDGTPTRIYCSF